MCLCPNFIFSPIYKKHLNLIVMGRKKLSAEEKRKELTIHLPKELYEKFEELGIKNKSKFFNWLFENYFNNLNYEK